jgi:hypothetical protein
VAVARDDHEELACLLVRVEHAHQLGERVGLDMLGSTSRS